MPRTRLRKVDWAVRVESDRDQGQEEAQSRDPEPREDYKVRRRENRFDLPDVSDNLVNVEVPGESHPGGPEAQAHQAHRGPPPRDRGTGDSHQGRRHFRHEPFALRFHDDRKSLLRYVKLGLLRRKGTLSHRESILTCSTCCYPPKSNPYGLRTWTVKYSSARSGYSGSPVNHGWVATLSG